MWLARRGRDPAAPARWSRGQSVFHSISNAVSLADMERRLTAILAADVVGYSRMMGANEAGTLEALKAVRVDFADGSITQYQGRVVNLTGDGMLVEFPSVVNAVRCAAEIQRGMRDRNVDLPQDRRIEFRVGVNLGDVIVEGDDIFGDGVNVAARLESVAEPGGITVSDSVGQELGVAFILEGSVRKVGERVRVTGQLVSSKDGGHVWAERFDRDLTDIFAIQDEITHAIVEQLKVKLLPQEKKSIGQVPTENIEAYTYYLRGRDFLHRRSKHYLQLARRMFAKAVELDPNYARAYAGMADCDSFLYMTYHADVPIDGILATTEKALALDPKLAEAHASRGVALSAGQRYEEAKAEFDKAIALNPESFEAHYFYARSNFAQGKIEQAIALFERAAEIRPDDYQIPCLLVGIYKSHGREQDAKDAAKRGSELAERELARHPEDSRPAQLGAGALFELGEKERAREWTARAMAIDPDDPVAQYNA